MKELLKKRSGGKCELCSSTEGLVEHDIAPVAVREVDKSICLCKTCNEQVENPEQMDANHWRCLNDAMWSEVPAVQVMSWRLLNRLRTEGWALDLIEMMYLSDETLVWAKADGESNEEGAPEKHRDSNGIELKSGDTVVLIKNLDVKGTSWMAKRGTSVRRISLVTDNPAHIEGKVNGQQIVILTEFVKKAN